MNDAFKVEAARLMLQKMFDGRYFDICAVDALIDNFGGRQSGEDYNSLRMLHCVHFDKMPEWVRAEIPERVARCLLPGLKADSIIKCIEGIRYSGKGIVRR